MATKGTSKFDYALLLMTIGIALFGVLMIYSAGNYVAFVAGAPYRFVSQQTLGLGIGLVLMIIVAGIDIKRLRGDKNKTRFSFNGAFALYLIALGLQIAVLFIGTTKNGAKRWINLGPVGFQPSELSKIAAILFMAYLIDLRRQWLDSFFGFLKIMCFVAPMIGMILVENMSSAIIVTGICVGMSFVASRRNGYFLICLGLLILGGACFIIFGEGFRAQRIDIWLHVETNPNGHQIKQGLYGISSGGIFGAGLGESMQKMGFIPEAYNDMIFSVICEELGIFGALLVLGLFGWLFFRIVKIALTAPTQFETMICVGVFIQLAIQVIINVAVVTNSIPSTGIPLPLISYGGTSAMIIMTELGLVLGISARSKY